MQKRRHSMGRLFPTGLRGPLRYWPLLLLPPLAGVVGRAMLPTNANAYLTFVYFDPQGPEEVLDAYHFDVTAVYTSGLGWVQLLALLGGAILTLRDPRLKRGFAPHPLPNLGSLLVGKAAVAAILAAVLARIDLAVVRPLAEAQLAGHWALAQLAEAGVSAPRLSAMAGRSLSTAVECAQVNAVLFAVLGVGLGAWAGRWWLPGTVAGSPGGFFLLSQAVEHFRLDTIGVLDALSKVLLVIVGIPTVPFVVLWYLTLTPGLAESGVVLTLVVAVGTGMIGWVVCRRRLTQPAPTPNAQP